VFTCRGRTGTPTTRTGSTHLTTDRHCWVNGKKPSLVTAAVPERLPDRAVANRTRRTALTRPAASARGDRRRPASGPSGPGVRRPRGTSSAFPGGGTAAESPGSAPSAGRPCWCVPALRSGEQRAHPAATGDVPGCPAPVSASQQARAMSQPSQAVPAGLRAGPGRPSCSRAGRPGRPSWSRACPRPSQGRPRARPRGGGPSRGGARRAGCGLRPPSGGPRRPGPRRAPANRAR
jgi:hypothetical protein